MSMPVSIVIPAHNEAAVIRRCLDRLTRGAAPGELDVIVVCNGCTDDTAAVCRAYGAPVRIVETDVPSKSNALNLGDRAAVGFPRFFVDADVVLEIDAIRQVADVLRAGPALAAAPLMAVDVTGRSWAVRAYYDVWLRLPYCRSGMIGSGVYAVSEAGRTRFVDFPAITADDAFVRLNFAPHERRTVETCRFTVVPPTDLARIVKIKTRAHFGNAELRERFGHLWRNEDAHHGSALRALALDPRRWPGLAVYGYVKLLTRLRVRTHYRHANRPAWERDDSSRQQPAGAAGVAGAVKA